MEQKDEPIKFHRPPNNDEFKQSKKEKDMMAYTVLFQCPNSTAYAFFNPEVCDKNGKLNKAGQSLCRQFFSHPNNIAYMDALKAHLSAVAKGGEVANATDVNLSDEQIDKAFRTFVKKAIKDIEDGKEIDNEKFKILMELFKKLGKFGTDVEEVMKPLRVLMARCLECRYRIGVESMVLNGQMLDMCAYCKCRKIAEEHGYRFNDGKDLLEIPKEIIDELESKNDVKLLDIINGKIDN